MPNEVSEVGRTVRHACVWCDDFWVEEPPSVMTTEWNDSGSVTVKWTRAAWELPMVTHWFEDHPDRFQVVFPGVVLLSDALLATAARAQATLTGQLRRAGESLAIRC